MKKLLFIASVFIALLVCSFILMALYMPPKEPTLSDCIEFGICKEGTKTVVNNEEVTITKDYCLKHNYKWDDEYKIGHIRDYSN